MFVFYKYFYELQPLFYNIIDFNIDIKFEHKNNFLKIHLFHQIFNFFKSGW